MLGTFRQSSQEKLTDLSSFLFSDKFQTLFHPFFTKYFKIINIVINIYVIFSVIKIK